MKRRGFTLIELLITIGILVILATIVVFASRSIIGGSKIRSTHVALDNCKSLLAEYDTVKKISTARGQCWIWWDGSANQMIDPTTIDPATGVANTWSYWIEPFSHVATFPQQDVLDAPGYVKNDSLGQEQRNASRAVVNTMMVMG